MALAKLRKLGWLFAAGWLFYLVGNLSALWNSPAGGRRDLGLAALVAFSVVYLGVVGGVSRFQSNGVTRAQVDRRMMNRFRAAAAALVVLAALQIPAIGFHALTCPVYIATAALIILPLREGIALAVVLALGTAALGRLTPGWHDDGHTLAVLLGSLATWGVRLAGERQERLIQAQGEIAALAVTNERARIATDLHDILGHSLTVVTIKAELAQRLLDVDLDKARAELQDLEALARDALSDVRATALGMRGISLPGEIAAARTALAAAHVAVDLPAAADEVPSELRELFAWTIREAVTNIVRHSRATHCEVRLSPDSVEIIDNGLGAPTDVRLVTTGGQGLTGLRRRAEALDATLSVGRRQDGAGFRVRVEVRPSRFS